MRGLTLCAVPPPRAEALRRVAERWPEPDRVLPVHSLHGGLDLTLRALALPPGTPVLVTAVARWEVLDQLVRHGLDVIPVDVDPETLAPRPTELEPLLIRGVGALIVTHLWGSRVPLAPFARLARERGVAVVEDASHAFRDLHEDGSPGATVSLFGFGPGASPTALGGGLAMVRDPALLARMRRLCAGYPVEPRRVFAGELLGAAVRLVGQDPALYRAARVVLEELAAADLEAGARRRLEEQVELAPRALPPWRRLPSAARLAFLSGRLGRVDPLSVRRRRAMGRFVARRMPRVLVAGRRALGHTWSRTVIVSSDPRSVRDRLDAEGFECAPVLGPYVVATRAGLAPARAAALLAGGSAICADLSVPIEDLVRLADTVDATVATRT